MPGYTLAVPVTCTDVKDALWRALNTATEPMTVRGLHIATGARPQSVLMCLRRWEQAALVTASQEQPRRFAMNDTSPTPPAVGPNGRVNRRPLTRQKIWTALRILKTFDIPTLVMTSGEKHGTINWYVHALRRAGYIQTSSKSGGFYTYTLIKRSGRKAPMISQTKSPEGLVCTLVDPNDGCRIILPPGQGIVRARLARSEAADPVTDGGVG